RAPRAASAAKACCGPSSEAIQTSNKAPGVRMSPSLAQPMLRNSSPGGSTGDRPLRGDIARAAILRAMEPLPRGANFVRAKMLWEIGLHIAGNPATPYYGNRDLRITVGSGSGEAYKPWLSMATGSPVLAHAVARGELDL